MSSVPRFRPESLLPALSWMRRYDRATFLRDALAALIVSLMLVPQSLAYAMLAGLPEETQRMLRNNVDFGQLNAVITRCWNRVRPLTFLRK